MPDGSFTLVLDDGGAPDFTSRIFERIVVQCAAWQAAADQNFDSWSFERRWDGSKRETPWFIFGTFPGAIQDIVRGNSSVRLTFPVGNPYQADEIFAQHRGQSIQDWTDAFRKAREPHIFQTPPPLPVWAILQLQDLLEKEGAVKVMNDMGVDGASHAFIWDAIAAASHRLEE